MCTGRVTKSEKIAYLTVECINIGIIQRGWHLCDRETEGRERGFARKEGVVIGNKFGLACLAAT